MAEPDMVLQDEQGAKYPDYSPNSTGWYKDFTPQQRYVAYLTTWIGVAELMVDGREQEIDEESLALLAWAPHDTQAYDVAEEMLASDRYPGARELHQRVYGDGKAEAADGYGSIDLPKINRGDISRYNMDMIGTLEGGVPRQQTGAFYDPGAFEKTAAWLASTVGESVGAVQGLMGNERTDEPVTGEDLSPHTTNPTQRDMFHTASVYGHSPESRSVDYQILAGDIGQFAAEGYLAAVGVGAFMGATSKFVSKVPQTGVNAAARAAAQTSDNVPFIQRMVQGANRLKSGNTTANLWQATRMARRGSAAVSTLTLGGLLATAQWGNLDLEDVTSNLDPATQQKLMEVRRQYSPIPYKSPHQLGRNTDTTIGRMGGALQDKLDPTQNPVADAWQDSQRRP